MYYLLQTWPLLLLNTWRGGQIGYTFYWSKAMCLMHQYQADTGGEGNPFGWRLTDYAPLCLRHMYLLTAPFVWRIILYFSTVLQTHIVAWLPYLVDGLYFTLSQTHVLTAQGKTAQTMGLVLRCPLLHLDWWCNHKAWKIQMTGIYLITTLMKVCPGYTISSPLIWGSYAMKKALRLLISTAKRCS